MRLKVVSLHITKPTLCGMTEERVEVRGQVYGHLAITPGFNERGYRITHVPSGLMLPKRYLKTTTAKRDLDRILPLIDWSLPGPNSISDEDRVRVLMALRIKP